MKLSATSVSTCSPAEIAAAASISARGIGPVHLFEGRGGEDLRELRRVRQIADARSNRHWVPEACANTLERRIRAERA